jgi:outer membrane protein insertion porin family
LRARCTGVCSLLLAVAVAVAAMLGTTSPLRAQGAPAGGPVVSRILVEGAQRIEPDTIRTYLRLTEGDPFDRERIDASLKALFGARAMTS